MADISLIYQKDQVKQLNNITKGLKSNDTAIDKVAKSIAELDGVIKKSKPTLETLNGILKKANGLNVKINVTNKKIAASQNKVKKATSEAAKIQRQYNTVKEKSRIVEGNYSKALIKQNQEYKKNKRAVEQNIIIQTAQKGAYDKIAAALSKNIAKWKSLSQAERENTKAGKQLTATIRQQDTALKKLDANIGRHQRNVGNYKGSIVGLEEKIQKLTTAQRRTNLETEKGKRVYIKLQNQIDKTRSTINNYNKTVTKTKNVTKNFGTSLKGIGSQLFASFGIIAGIMAFTRVLKSGFNTLRLFTKENAVLAGVLGRTRKEVEELTDQAIALGAVYPVTASEVTKLQVSYARLGFTMSDIQNLTEATILGSISLNAELDATATLVGAVVKAYNELGTADAGKIIDQLTLATQRSSLSFSSLETALPKVAGAANALNESLSGTLSKLAVAQDATLDASVAGTSLRNIYLEITKKGLTYNEAMDKINNSSNKLLTAFDLFGKRGAIVALALANNKDKAEELRKEFDTTGNVAERVAKEQMATLDGAIKGLGSSWEKTILSFKESEGFFSKLITRWTNELDVFSSEYLSFWQKRIGAIPILGGKVIEKTKQFNNALLEANRANNELELRLAISNNTELLSENEDFHRDFTKAVENRLKSIEKLEDEADKRKEISENQAKVERVAFIKELEDIRKTSTEKEIEKTTEKYNTLIKRAEKFGLDAVQLEQDLANEIKQIRTDAEEEANKEIEKKRKEYFKNLRAENKRFVKDNKTAGKEAVIDEGEAVEDRIKSQNKLDIDGLNRFTEKQKQRAKDIEDGKKTSAEIITDAKDSEQQKESNRREIIHAGIDATAELLSNRANKKSEQIQTEIEELNAKRTEELANEELTREERAAINAKYDKQEAALKNKKAKADQKAAVNESLINTAVGVTKALASANFILAGIIGFQGLVQTGIIKSKKVEQFADGTKNAPGTGFIAGDKKGGGAARELMTLRTGEVMMVNKPTYFEGNKFKGATINSNPETERIIAQAESKNVINFDTKELRKQNDRNTNRLIKAFNRREIRQSRAISNAYKERFL